MSDQLEDSTASTAWFLPEDSNVRYSVSGTSPRKLGELVQEYPAALLFLDGETVKLPVDLEDWRFMVGSE